MAEICIIRYFCALQVIEVRNENKTGESDDNIPGNSYVLLNTSKNVFLSWLQTDLNFILEFSGIVNVTITTYITGESIICWPHLIISLTS